MTDDEELRNKAKIIAEATGRSEEQVLEDLLDDGIVNLSNEEKKDKDLVQQLREAAELITTVQSISQEVSENTVLNGGENKTEVKVETTLDGDVVDRAIDSLQRKADNIKKLALTLVPIFLLITGGSMEAFGVIDIVGSDDVDNVDDVEYETVWGCTVADADNYNPDATDDDGSCWWDNGGGGGGGPPANCNWMWDDTSYTNDANPNSLYVRVSFSSPECDYEQEGDFEVHLLLDGEHYDMEEEYHTKFFENYDLEFQFDDLSAGEYVLRLSFDSYESSEYHWDSPRTYLFEEHNQGCEPNWIWDSDAIYDFDSDGQGYNNDIRVQSRFADDNKCNIHMDNGYFEILVGDFETRTINNNFHDEYVLDETFRNIPEGNYYVEIDYYTNDGSSWNGASAYINVEGEPQQNVECNPYVYSLQLYVQSVNEVNEVSVESDIDCSNSEGSEEITVFFFVNENGSDMSEPPLESNFDNYTVSGADLDMKTIRLNDFEVSNNNKYDFFWSAFWETGSADYQWLNVEIGDIESEPESCENLTLTSNGITLENISNNLTMGWDLTHDGEVSSSCFVEIELSITLYQNGTYLDISDFHKNGNYKIYANGSIYVDSSMVDIFSELPQGTYEVLVKYRIVGDSESSQDYFANTVSIE